MIWSRFYGLYYLGHVTLDWGLIISLVERWHPETHAFHLLVGEMTITLQGVAIILGLHIHGPPLTGTCDLDWSLLCQVLLRAIPPPSKIKGSVISTQWLSQQFSTPSIETNDVTLERCAQAFIIALLGSTLFVDKKGMHVHLYFLSLLRDLTETSMDSWSSAILTHFYEELCQESFEGARNYANTYIYILKKQFVLSLVEGNGSSSSNRTMRKITLSSE